MAPSPALRADPPLVVVAQADPVDVVHDEFLDEGMALEAIVHVDLAVPRDLSDLAVVLIPAPAVGAGTLRHIVGSLLGWTGEEGGQRVEQAHRDLRTVGNGNGRPHTTKPATLQVLT